MAERTGMPAHQAHEAKHHTPHPLFGKGHPAAAHQAKAPQHAANKARAKATGRGQHHRATVVTAANPATVQLHGSDQTVLWNLAQHVTVASLTPGGAVVGVVFDEADPNDGLITGVY